MRKSLNNAYADLPRPYNPELEIHKACRDGNIQQIFKLLSNQPSLVNVSDEKLGWTPLYRVTICGFLDAAKFLLRHKADPNLPNHLGETPLHQAADNGLFKFAQLLLEYRADPNVQQNDGNTPMHLACFKGDLRILRLLLQYGADPNVQNQTLGRTPLHIVVDGCQYEIAEILMEAGASVRIKDHVGKTAIDYAQTTEMARILGKMSGRNEEDSIYSDRYRLAQTTMNCSTDSIGDKPTFMSFTGGVPTRGSKCVTETFDEYLKRMKEKEQAQNAASTNNTSEIYQFYQESVESTRNEDLVRIETQLTRSNKLLDTLREEDSKFEATGALHKLIEEEGDDQIDTFVQDKIMEGDTTNMNYSKLEFAPQLFEDITKEAEDTGKCVAVFKSVKNDILPREVKKQRQTQEVDICAELLKEIEQYHKKPNPSWDLDTLHDQTQHYESMLSQANKLKSSQAMGDLLPLEHSKNQPNKRDTLQPVVFQVESVGNTSRHTVGVVNQDQVTFRNTSIDPKPHTDLDQWLESIKLKQIGTTLARSGILTLETLLGRLKSLSYENAQLYLKSKGIDKKGNRERIILAADQVSGKFQTYLEEHLKNSKSKGMALKKPEVHFGLECCGKPPRMCSDFLNPPELKKWLKDQAMENIYHRFAMAGYDDYEWLLMHMISEHPLTDTILAKEIGIGQAGVRSRLLYKLQEGIVFCIKHMTIEAEGYLEQVMVPKYGLGTLYESVSKTEACGCIIF